MDAAAQDPEGHPHQIGILGGGAGSRGALTDSRKEAEIVAIDFSKLEALGASNSDIETKTAQPATETGNAPEIERHEAKASPQQRDRDAAALEGSIYGAIFADISAFMAHFLPVGWSDEYWNAIFAESDKLYRKYEKDGSPGHEYARKLIFATLDELGRVSDEVEKREKAAAGGSLGDPERDPEEEGGGSDE